ncbi:MULTISPECIES: GNAT family N-acetyltransferase [Streptomyces]|uniref:GNAT family N-acetyltransferase n=1 Tax=Streptomyces TaxID=1883 RepID=UPI00163C6690|nr:MULTISPECIES: GNAT family N-acetyltransferase [Streptomyces]MBC2876224.1 GNAT family N-acetyltransferase [Streptomyces sp. TYQ1024]UBI35550.1 GNAT family N-acetyltransferase [Streptomyces mobaraensis]UKW28144.1 GNAT family N-acetyltransferase [Streptomyces sp. TYQ1024]
MFAMRPATAADIPAVETMILARSGWLEDRGLPSWRENAADLARQAENPDGDVWVLADDDAGRLIGFITVQDQTPPWGWTEEELAEPAHYLYSSVTDPAYRRHKPGTTMAMWAVDRAAVEGKQWVRRGCNFPGLVTYNESQGFKLLHEVQRTHTRVYLMARRAEPVKDLRERFAVLQG